MEHDTVRIPSMEEMDAFIKDQEILDAHVRSLSDEEKDKVFDMGYHNDTIKGYIAIAMQENGFGEEAIMTTLMKVDGILEKYSAQEARHFYSEL